jgi:hypothetical protein
MENKGTTISSVISWLEKQKEKYGDIDVRLTSEWMEINTWCYYDPNDPENPQWVKDNMGKITKPFVMLGPANCELSQDRSETIRYNRNLSPSAFESFIDDIEEKLDKLAAGETTIYLIKTKYLDVIKSRLEKR